ncbi:hypothetical protein LCI18_004019 [Fusarium solani-melongenae]|uniref:Uncharacterized protein n=1 Tax=Fusarium solani subsp. cucurbitae TaxID=2747967 RepID=A0ACD3YVT5_FUSSC|nr:hypothetical protein LCI18_004019 [Fusarium solani-melongenae]
MRWRRSSPCHGRAQSHGKCDSFFLSFVLALSPFDLQTHWQSCPSSRLLSNPSCIRLKQKHGDNDCRCNACSIPGYIYDPGLDPRTGLFASRSGYSSLESL